MELLVDNDMFFSVIITFVVILMMSIMIIGPAWEAGDRLVPEAEVVIAP